MHFPIPRLFRGQNTEFVVALIGLKQKADGSNNFIKTLMITIMVKLKFEVSTFPFQSTKIDFLIQSQNE